MPGNGATTNIPMSLELIHALGPLGDGARGLFLQLAYRYCKKLKPPNLRLRADDLHPPEHLKELMDAGIVVVDADGFFQMPHIDAIHEGGRTVRHRAVPSRLADRA